MANRILTLALAFFALSISTAGAAEVGVVVRDQPEGRHVALFSVANPATPLAPPAVITGVPASQRVAAVDYQPSTGKLYMLAVNKPGELLDGGRLYTLNPLTGVATALGGINTAIKRDNAWDIDFDPVSGRIRLLGAYVAPTNLLVDPVTGFTVPGGAGAQPFVPPASTRFVAAGAYDNSVSGAATSTNYIVDGIALYRMGDVGGAPTSPGSGRLTKIGDIAQDSVSASLEALDISGASGRAYGLVYSDAGGGTMISSRFNLATGANTHDAAPVFDFAEDLAIAPSSAVHLAQPAPTREGATATIQVVRRGPGSGPVTVPFTVTPSTAGAVDFRTPASGTLQFAAGEQAKTISTPIVDDKATEGGEAFTVALGEPAGTTTSGAVVAGGPGSVSVQIAASDPKVGIGPRRVRLSRKGVATFKLACPRAAAAPCTGTLKLQRKIRKRYRTIGSKRFSIAPGKSKKVRVKVTRSARRLVAKKRKLRVRGIVTGASAGKRSVTLLRPRS
jgi:hypothetical protein